jgi:hypothetical protein
MKKPLSATHGSFHLAKKTFGAPNGKFYRAKKKIIGQYENK